MMKNKTNLFVVQKPSRAEKPQLIDPSHPKVPMTVRIPYLNKIHAQYLEFLSPSEAKEMVSLLQYFADQFPSNYSFEPRTQAFFQRNLIFWSRILCCILRSVVLSWCMKRRDDAHLYFSVDTRITNQVATFLGSFPKLQLTKGRIVEFGIEID